MGIESKLSSMGSPFAVIDRCEKFDSSTAGIPTFLPASARVASYAGYARELDTSPPLGRSAFAS